MTNKELIKKLKDNAELAWAAYGYFHLANKNYKPEEYSKDWYRLKYFREDIKKDETAIPTPADILDITYKYYLDDNGKPKNGLLDDKLFDGEFSPNQAKRFFERYDLLLHQPNTDSGFSATLFQDKETKEYTLAIRGTEMWTRDMWITDLQLATGYIPNQYFDMILFYLQCKGDMPFHIDIESKEFVESKNTTKYKIYKTIYNNQKEHKPYINPRLLKDSTQEATLENFISPIDSNTKLNITGHSLGGALTQMLVLSLCDDKNEANINEAYTFNSPGARDLKPPYDTIIYYTTDTKEMIAKQLREKAGKTNKYIFETNSKINYMLNKIAKNNNTHFGINFCVDTAGEEDRASVTYKKIDNALVCFYETLIKNYEKGNTKVDKENKYKLSISDRVHHIESSTNEEANKCYISSPIALLGEDIAGLYHTINEKEGSHSIKYLTWYLYLYDYLLSDVNVNSKWEWNLDNLNRFIQMVFHLNKNHFKMFKTDTNKSKTEKTKITNIHKTPLLTIISDLLFITRDTLFECQIFAKGFYDNEEIKKRLDENYAIDTLMLMQEHNIELKLFSFYRDEQSLLDKTLFKVSTFYSLYAFKPYEVYKNNKAYLTKDNLELVFGYNADFAQCFYGKDKILHIESAKNIEYGYMKHFHILWNNPQDVDEKSPIVNMGNINNNKASFILIKGE